MSKREFRYHSIEPEGLWTSEVFGPSEHRHIVQGVIGGFLMKRPRWATDLDGNFIYGLDAKGKELTSPRPKGRGFTSSPKLFPASTPTASKLVRLTPKRPHE